MLATIRFDDQAPLDTDEIGEIRPNRVLPPEPEARESPAAKGLPEHAFGIRGRLSQRSRPGYLIPDTVLAGVATPRSFHGSLPCAAPHGDYTAVANSPHFWTAMLSWIDRQPLLLFVAIALTLGLAPFVPEPHLWEKLKMLAAGQLSRPIDIFDLLLHGIPWLLLGVKVYRTGFKPRT
jgi:hypothetical protein